MDTLSVSTSEVHHHGRTIQLEPVLHDPKILQMHGILSAEEAEAIVTAAHESNKLKRSQVVGLGASDGRTSHSCSLSAKLPVVRNLILRASAIVGIPPNHAEPLAVLRYEAGGQYRAHYDFFNCDGPKYHEKMASGGQRVVSVVCYLRCPTEGGSTAFPTLGKSFAPAVGGAVAWWNLTDGLPDQRTLHAGQPVLSGEKWICTVWFRERPRRPESKLLVHTSVAMAMPSMPLEVSIPHDFPMGQDTQCHSHAGPHEDDNTASSTSLQEVQCQCMPRTNIQMLECQANPRDGIQRRK